MDRTPQSLRSSVSPYQQCGRTSGYRRITSHPSSPHNEPKSMHPGPENALGLYGYNIPTSSSKVTTGNLLPPSPQPSELWARPSVTEQSLSYCSQPPQDIFSAAYDPFANVSNNPPPSFMRPAFTSGPPDGPEYRTTSMTSPSNVPSHRSSFSSTCTTSEAYSHPGSELGYTPKVKIEDTNEWYTGSSNHSNMHAQMAGQRLVSSPQHHGPVHVPLPTMQRPQSAAWSNYDLRSENNGGQYDESSRSDSYRHPKSDTEHPIITDVARTRKRRQLTTPSEANHECRVCGKLFGRSYNYKAHMDTHDPARVYPHICSVRNCNKKFVRKTDLVRHEDSVHNRLRNFKCELCESHFARKDTLRRHTEDGCPKRFEISSKGARDGMNSPKPVRTSAGMVPMRTRGLNSSGSQPRSVSSSQASPSHTSMSHNNVYHRQDYADPQEGYMY